MFTGRFFPQLVTEKGTDDVYAMKKIKKSIENTTQIKEERNIMANAANLSWITTLHYAFQVT
jgi:citron Rho-interacting kinase